MGIAKVLAASERAVSSRAEALTGSRNFADAAATVVRMRRGLFGVYELGTRAALHAVRLPTLGDLRQLNRQVASLTAEVRELNARLEHRERQ